MLTITSDDLINYGALATMLLGAYALYLCFIQALRSPAPARRKR